MIKILVVLMLSLTMAGCGLGGISLTNDMSSTNALIAQSNTDRYKAFTGGMAACGENAACQVGVAMGFAGNLGQQQFMRPETTLDLMKGIVPFAQLALDFYKIHEDFGGGSASGEASPYVKGNGNVVNVFNKNNLKDSSMSAQLTPEINQTDQFSWEGSNYGTQKAQDPVIVEPFIVEPGVTTAPETPVTP